MALKAFRGKIVFLGGSGSICGILEWLEGFCINDRGSCGVYKFSEIFVDFLSGLGYNRE
jgi:hypothetical protein